MQSYALLVAAYLVMEASAAFAYVQGGRGERLGAAWFAMNMAVGFAVNLLGFDSPLAHLIADGIFALGLLPLAMIFVSYWIGLVTLIAAALFGLEAIYLLNEWSTDKTYAWINNCLWLTVPLVFLSSGVYGLLHKRRRRRQVQTLEAAAVGC